MSEHPWLSVNMSDNCLVCGKPDYCRRTASGNLLTCMRSADAPQGYKHIRTTKSGGNLFGLVDGSSNNLLPKPKPRRPAPPKPHRDFAAIHTAARARVIPGELADLADELGIDGDAFDLLDVGVEDEPGSGWLFPERDAEGHVIGMVRRTPDGRKLALRGSRRGLTFVHPFPAVDPVLVVEGASDTAAAIDAGFNAVGRPSNAGAGELLAQLLRGRHVIATGENDAKPNGSWPGREGVEAIVPHLLPVCKSVRTLYPPPTAKDVRSWLTAGGVK